MKNFTSLLILLLANRLSAAPIIEAKLRIDSTTFKIGEQVTVHLSATSDGAVKIFWPKIADSLNSLTVINPSPIDTIITNGNSKTYHQQFSITSFDSGFYVITPISFFASNDGVTIVDSAATAATLITVNTIPVDTAAAIKPIKPLMDAQLNWRDYLLFISLAIGILILLVIIYLLIKRKPIAPQSLPIITPSIPLNEFILGELKKIEDEKLWQNGKVKEYYSTTTDIIRLYLEKQFKIPALEFTTEEITQTLIIKDLPVNEFTQLKQMLQQADLVKFAKYIPLPADNSLLMEHAKTFVMKTFITVEKKSGGEV
ncbi:MAG: hypothetical protein RIQ89_1575 [Bacteroidota bacterium]|jgi:hypothetical protein